MSASTFKWSGNSEFTQWNMATAAASAAGAGFAANAADSASLNAESASAWVADAKAVGWAAVPW